MATEYNITQKQYNGVDYDTLYPETTSQQVLLNDSAISYSDNPTVNGALIKQQTDIAQLNSNLALKSGNINVTDGWTVQDSNNWCRKSGHVAEFYLEVTGGTLASGWNNLGTLPSGFTPLFSVNIVGVDNGSSGVPACQVQIQSNGTISVYKHSALTNNLRIFGVYLVA